MESWRPRCMRFGWVVSAALSVQTGAALANPVVLAELSLEQLAALPVISVSRSDKPLSQASASIYVITQQEIQRAGFNSLPEVLRLAPNLQVAQVDARNYAISARGFNGPFANKLLVLVDGRSVYSHLFSGVFWDAQDLVLEDLDRVEVISGPGGTLWGANAVNGVINYVTRSARETQGGLVSLGGSGNDFYTAARYGGTLAGDGYFRVYGKHSSADDTFTGAGLSTETGWQRSQLGFRTDWERSDAEFTLQGDAFTGRLGQIGTNRIEIGGANLLARGRRTLSSASQVVLQVYVDHTSRDQPTAFRQRLNTVDLELQHEWRPNQHHQLVWGGGYRYSDDQIDNYGNFTFLPESEHFSWRSLFVQDQIKLAERLRLTVGTKFEANPFTGWETLPSLQLSWEHAPGQLLWTSFSRAVRSPSRVDTDFYSPPQPEVVDGVPQYQFAGGPNFRSETAEVAEVGFRGQFGPAVSYSITGFHHRYKRLRTLEVNTDGPGFEFTNGARGRSYGVESWGAWQVRPDWRLRAGLVLQELEVELEPGVTDLLNVPALANGDPEYYWLLRSSYDFSESVGLETTLRGVDQLENVDLPAYTELNLRLGWTLRPGLVFSLIGRNLLHDKHPEFDPEPGRSVFERAIYGKLQWGL